MITMSNARRQFSGRHMVSPAVKDGDKRIIPRKNARNPAGPSFKQWARETFRAGQDLSPKLRRILGA